MAPKYWTDLECISMRAKSLHPQIYICFLQDMWFLVSPAICSHQLVTQNWLVVELSLWQVLVSWDAEIPNRWKHKEKCSKPPTRQCFLVRSTCWVVDIPPIYIYIYIYIYIGCRLDDVVAIQVGAGRSKSPICRGAGNNLQGEVLNCGLHQNRWFLSWNNAGTSLKNKSLTGDWPLFQETSKFITTLALVHNLLADYKLISELQIDRRVDWNFRVRSNDNDDGVVC